MGAGPIAGRPLAGAAALAGLLLLATAPPARAQVPRVVTAPADAGFLTNFNYHLALEAFSGDDPEFRWDADFGGDFDIVGTPTVRVNALFNYEAILGEEFQPFDPNQGNYVIEVVGGRRWGRTEAAVVFHHTSRHLGDRPKTFGVAWNLLGAQLTWTSVSERRTWQVQGRAAAAVMTDAVDYTGEFSANALYVRHSGGRADLVSRAAVLARTTDAGGSFLTAPRSTQVGARGEAGVRVLGRRAVLEIVAGVERRVDAAALFPRGKTWAVLAARIMTRD